MINNLTFPPKFLNITDAKRRTSEFQLYVEKLLGANIPNYICHNI